MRIDYSLIEGHDLEDMIRNAMEFGVNELKLADHRNFFVQPAHTGVHGYNDVSGKFLLTSTFSALQRKYDSESPEEMFKKFHRSIFHELGHASHYQKGYSIWLDPVGKRVGNYVFRLYSWKEDCFVTMRDEAGQPFKVFKAGDELRRCWDGECEAMIRDMALNRLPIWDWHSKDWFSKYKLLPWEKYADNIAAELLKKYAKARNGIPVFTQ